jgi:hypothetical protein
MSLAESPAHDDHVRGRRGGTVHDERVPQYVTCATCMQRVPHFDQFSLSDFPHVHFQSPLAVGNCQTEQSPSFKTRHQAACGHAVAPAHTYCARFWIPI